MSKPLNIHKNMSVADCQRAARSLGVAVEAPRRTGELLFLYEGVGRCRVAGRRKNTPQPLIVFLRKVQKARKKAK